ncbi:MULTISPECIES: tRNA pseudouridine(13) synthase TruD [Salinibaculum]|uniref:tRNA pseudouridine(13) synthase TruD n=1 Tax=Salinibaculum TaxID=2732368 RepID=UPI0030D157C5
MREAHDVERAVGMDYYVSDADGIGGRLRDSPADFRVTERELFATEPVDADPGAYPHLVLRVTLSDWDTNDFAGALSDRLGISRERVSWAGTKDKRAVTTQLFSVDGIDSDALPDLPDADVEVVGRAGRPVLFGDLAGNDFAITVRDPDAPENVDAITADLREFAGASDGDDTTVAVPNYFGQQRFGSRRPVTHEVGLAIARGDWEGAVMAYVGNPSDYEPERTREARAFVEETRDWAAALEQYPGHLGYERAMLHRLVEGDDEPGDFRAALETAPTNLQQLFVNAAQSYVFNRILSARLERGLPFAEPVEGDVVCFADRDAPEGLTVPDTDRTQRVTEGRVRSVSRHCERGRAFVTAPLVGTETELADGDPGDVERAVLDAVGIEPADFDLPDEFHSEGTRRAVAVRTALTIDRDPLTFAFSLPRGSYATVVLREYLKRDPAAR